VPTPPLRWLTHAQLNTRIAATLEVLSKSSEWVRKSSFHRERRTYISHFVTPQFTSPFYLTSPLTPPTFTVSHLCLHLAATNGLVKSITSAKYALSHDHSINLLNGVLPLHAASSGGNDLMVKLFIEKGVLRGERFSFSFCVVITLLSSSSLVYLVGRFFFWGQSNYLMHILTRHSTDSYSDRLRPQQQSLAITGITEITCNTTGRLHHWTTGKDPSRTSGLPSARTGS